MGYSIAAAIQVIAHAAYTHKLFGAYDSLSAGARFQIACSAAGMRPAHPRDTMQTTESERVRLHADAVWNVLHATDRAR